MNPGIKFQVNPGLSAFTSLFLLLFSAISCSNDKEPDPIAPACCEADSLGGYTMLPESRTSIPYQENTNLYFRDNADNEIMFIFRPDDQSYGITDNGTLRTCPCDPEFKQVIKVGGDAYHYFLSEIPRSLNITFLLDLSLRPFHGEDNLIADVLNISISDNSDSTSYSGLMSILVNQRNLTSNYITGYKNTPIDSVLLLDKWFSNVYLDDEGTVWYNFDQGLIAFRDRSEKIWVLDRIEEQE